MPRELSIIIAPPERIQAIQEGRMTQFRQVIDLPADVQWRFLKWNDDGCALFFTDTNPSHGAIIKPRYLVGDELWCKEIYGWAMNSHGHQCLCYKADDGPIEPQMMRLWDTEQKKWVLEETEESAWPPDKWNSSHCMPKDFARLWRRVTAVKDPHQIQNISEEDAIAEGIRIVHLPHKVTLYHVADWPDPMAADIPRGAFYNLWNRLHPKPGERWEDHPWVWPTVFERIER